VEGVLEEVVEDRSTEVATNESILAGKASTSLSIGAGVLGRREDGSTYCIGNWRGYLRSGLIKYLWTT